MQPEQYFAFQISRCFRKEDSSRNDVVVAESEGRSRLWRWRQRHFPSLTSNESETCSTTDEDDDISDTEQVLDASACRSAADVVGCESRDRLEIVTWEATCRNTLSREDEMRRAEDSIRRFTLLESEWRSRIERDQLHGVSLAQRHWARFMAKWIVDDHCPNCPLTEVHWRLGIQRLEQQVRFHVLAVTFCAWLIAWNEAWSRITIAACRVEGLKYFKSLSMLWQRESEEWSAIRGMGRPVIDHVLAMASMRAAQAQALADERMRRERERFILLQQMADRIERPDDFVLQEKQHMVEQILAIQDDLLEETLDHAPISCGAAVFERVRSSYEEVRATLLSDPSTPFRELQQYRDQLLRLRAPSSAPRVDPPRATPSSVSLGLTPPLNRLVHHPREAASPLRALLQQETLDAPVSRDLRNISLSADSALKLSEQRSNGPSMLLIESPQMAQATHTVHVDMYESMVASTDDHLRRIQSIFRTESNR